MIAILVPFAAVHLAAPAIALSVDVAGVVQPEVRPAAPAKAAKPAGFPRVLVMRDLARKPVKLIAITGEQLQVVGTRGRTASISRRDVVAILPDGPVTVARPPGLTVLKTVQGEVFTGLILPPSEGERIGERIRWQSTKLGDVTLNLEQVSVLDFSPVTATTAAKASEDRVILTNGDVLAGFVEEVGATLRMEVGKQPREVAMDRVGRVELSNPVKPLEGSVVWLATGEVLRVTKVAGNANELTISRESKDLTVHPSDVIGWVDSAAGLVGLSTLPAVVTPGAGRSWADPIEIRNAEGPLGAGDVLLPSPMAVTWTLPERAVRVSVTAVLPAASRIWGDCVVVVEQVGRGGSGGGSGGGGGKELATVRLNGDRPEAEINVELVAGMGPMRIRLEEGENGPIQDRVLLRQPLVLVPR